MCVSCETCPRIDPFLVVIKRERESWRVRLTTLHLYYGYTSRIAVCMFQHTHTHNVYYIFYLLCFQPPFFPFLRRYGTYIKKTFLERERDEMECTRVLCYDHRHYYIFFFVCEAFLMHNSGEKCVRLSLPYFSSRVICKWLCQREKIFFTGMKLYHTSIFFV